ncbi:MAG: glycosyltransferase [Dysgonamonadaceae bacterium]|jgi:glycosyltransferase involved in cell wall biosynthesis|nr:glycosyltransferase [Dysgonamonadaceae bacterium]
MGQNIQLSVVMPVFNAEKYLREAIESILNQTFADFELIIINDGSTDESKNIILSYTDQRICYIENETNLGLIKTLNKGIKICKGKYIIRMDSDDICVPTRIEKQIRFMKKRPDVGLCGTWAYVIDDKGTITGKIINQTSPPFISISLLFSVPLIHPSTCFRASILKQNLYHEVPVAEDYDLWCRLNEQTKIANIPDFSLYYRWHNTNISREKQLTQEQNKEKLIREELHKSGLEPDPEMMRIHRLSFSLYSFGKETQTRISSSDLIKSGEWFSKLLSANKQYKRYKQEALTAFLWGRWIVLCKTTGQKRKIFFPPFVSCSPKVLYLLLKQILLLVRK